MILINTCYFIFFWILMIPWIYGIGEEDIRRIDEFIEAAMQCNHIPGMTLVVVDKHKELYKHGYGVSSEDGAAVTGDTLFPIASTTKAFTTTLLAFLLKKHNYTWDTPIKVFDPEFKLHNDILTEQVTLRDVLSHRTGIPGYFVALMAGFPEEMDLKDFVRSLEYHQPTHSLRTEFIYNNYMYSVAGYVAELLEGKPWQQLIRQYIFNPLNMTSSSFTSHLDQLNTSHFAHAFAYNNDTIHQIDLSTIHQVNKAEAAGAILSTASDMSKWLQFHLRSGIGNSDNAQLQEVYKSSMGVANVFPPDMTRPSFPVSDICTGYGLGWINSVYRGFRRIWHSGGILTYKSQVWLLPDIDKAIFLEDNGPQTASWAMINIAHFITDILTNESAWLNASTVCSFPEPWKSLPYRGIQQMPQDTPPFEFSKYEGTYSHPAFGEVTVYINGTSSKLMLKMGQFLVAELGYDEREKLFLMKLVDKYWYVDGFIPLRFKSPVCGPNNEIQLSILQMPLYSPYYSAVFISFNRTIAAQVSSACRNTLIVSLCYILILIVHISKHTLF